MNPDTLSDDEILSLTELELEPDQDARLSELLNCQQAGTVGEGDRTELEGLMRIYREGLLRKAIALREAVKRGLIASLNQ